MVEGEDVVGGKLNEEDGEDASFKSVDHNRKDHLEAS